MGQTIGEAVHKLDVDARSMGENERELFRHVIRKTFETSSVPSIEGSGASVRFLLRYLVGFLAIGALVPIVGNEQTRAVMKTRATSTPTTKNLARSQTDSDATERTAGLACMCSTSHRNPIMYATSCSMETRRGPFGFQPSGEPLHPHLGQGIPGMASSGHRYSGIHANTGFRKNGATFGRCAVRRQNDR